jgi:uncharacterized membrane protein
LFADNAFVDGVFELVHAISHRRKTNHMKAIVDFLKTTLVGGLLVVLPIWVSVLLLAKSLGMLSVFLKPIMDELPDEAQHPFLLSALILLLGCFAVGLLVRTSPGYLVRRFIQTHLLDHIPAYGVIRGMTQQLAHLDQAGDFAPCLAEIEEALVPAFVVERHADGRLTVFVPSAPTPIAGSIYILTPERVHPLDVSLLKVMRCITKWGSGSGELLAAMRSSDAKQS